MPKITSIIFTLCLGATVCSAATEKAMVAPAGSRPPEYSVLDKFVGTWNAQVEMVSADGKKSAQSSRNTFAWALNGRFLKDDGGQVGGSSSFLGLWTYDPQTKRYQSWYFQGPGGETLQVTYAWDEKNQTLSGKQDMGGGMTVETLDHFIDKDHYDWVVVVKDKDGHALNRLSAHSVRDAK